MLTQVFFNLHIPGNSEGEKWTGNPLNITEIDTVIAARTNSQTSLLHLEDTHISLTDRTFNIDITSNDWSRSVLNIINHPLCLFSPMKQMV